MSRNNDAKLRNLARLQDKLVKGLPLTDREKKFVRSYTTNTSPEILAQNYPAFATRAHNSLDINRVVPSFKNWAYFHSGIVKDIWETDEDFEARVRDLYNDHFRNLDQEAIKNIKYNPAPGDGFFKWNTGTGSDYLTMNSPGGIKSKIPHTYTSLDIETDDMGRPVSISALKFQYNKASGLFEQVDRYQRFYKANNRDLRMSTTVHGLTARSLSRLRVASKAGYSKSFDDTERDSLKEFLGSSTIVGHNIIEFDLQKLFGNGGIGNNTIDTLAASRNIWPDQKNDLDSVFQRLFGKSMEQVGLSHHDANADTIASMLILQAMASSKEGDAIRYAMSHPGTHIVPLDSMMGSQVASGYYDRFYPIGSYITMTEEEMKNAANKAFVYNKDGSGNFNPGVSIAAPEGFQDILSSIFEYIKENHGTGSGKYIANSEGEQSIIAAMNQLSFWKKGSLTEKISRIPGGDFRRQVLAAYGLNNKEGEGILDAAARLRKERDVAKALQDKERFGHVLDRSLERGQITKGQYNKLSTMSGSFEDLSNSMDEVIDKNQKMYNIFKAIGSIPMYNFERLESAFKGEVSGIKGAARGLVSNAVYSPFSRLVDASLNAMTETYAPFKYGVRAGTAIGGGLMCAGMAALGANPLIGGIVMGVGGGISALSQIIGNAKESQITQWGQGIQNNLNTLGFLKEMFLLPVKLLSSAVNMAVKSVTRFASAIRGITGLMTGGLGELSQMGNPLTGMTGVDYGSYMGSVSADYASLLGKGTVNGIYNDMASQRMKLYTTGQVDTNRLVASSMLGIFNQMYGSSMSEEDALTSALDSLTAQMKGQSEMEKKRTYVLANMVNPNLASLLQAMNTLGFDSFADMKKPSSMWGYGEDQADSYRRRFQRTQWEYQYGKTQLGVTKGRIASSLWDMAGRNIFDKINMVGDTLATVLETGNWEDLVAMIKDGASKLWETIKKIFRSERVQEVIGDIGTGIAKGLTVLKDTIMPTFYNLWESISSFVIDKTTKLVEFLSTIKIDWDALKQQLLTGKSDKPWITSLKDVTFENSGEEVKKAHGQAKAFYDPAVTAFISGANTWGAKSTFGTIPTSFTWSNTRITGGRDTTVSRTSSTDDIRGWLTNVMTAGTDDDIARLSAQLSISLGRKVKLKRGQSVDDFLDWVLRSGRNINAANFLNPAFEMDDDLSKSTYNRFSKELISSADQYGKLTLESLINMGLVSLDANRSEAALLKVQIADDKGNSAVDATIKADGSIETRRYNGFVDVETRDGIFQFQLNQGSKFSR